MGANGSALIGKALVDERLLQYTSWTNEDIKAMRIRHKNDLGGCFAMNPEHFIKLVQAQDRPKAENIFHEIFDTDGNNLVDAYEVLGGLAMISSMKIEEKVNFVHALYDFNGSGDITADEMTILMRTLACSLAKMDTKVSMPTIEHIEQLTTRAFRLADKDNDGEITKKEFDKYCDTAPNVKEFLKYTNGGANRVKLQAGELWEDPDFFGGSALYVNGSVPSAAAPAARHVHWLRPNELVPDEPVLFTEGKTLGILKQGALANAWFVNALSAASAKPKWIRKLFVATGQERQGRYCIQFWKNGDLQNVFVDDRIPCDMLGKPLYCTGADPNEFWMMLFEKAYAKLHGCYENLANGYLHHGLKDVTGNLTVMEMMDTPKGIVRCQDGDTWDDMMEWKKKKKLTITAMRRINIRTQAEHGDLECGILPGKVYYVQDLVETNGRRMMKLKNPWGMSPWTGKWSYGSNMWEENVEVMEVLNVDSKKKKIDVFWMEWEDFSRIFNTLYATADTCAWFTKRREGVYPDKGGGCPTYKTWKANPQYALEFENETEVIIDLSLPDTRVEAAAGRGVKVPAKYDKSIGFVLAAFDWGTPESPQRLTRIVREQCGDYCTMMFKPVRTVEHKFKLPAGKYVLVPMTYRPDKGGKFSVTVQSKKEFSMFGGEEVDFEGVDEDMEDDMADEFKQTKVGQVEEENANPQTNKKCSVTALQMLVNELTIQAKSLLKRKSDLEERLRKVGLEDDE